MKYYIRLNFAIQISVIILSAVFMFSSCKKENKSSGPVRTYYMGFMNSGPRYDHELVLQSLYMWTERADAAIISTEVPWDSLFSGTSAINYVLNNYKGIVDYYRANGLQLWVYLDPCNGLARESESRELAAMGKSITQADAQYYFRRFAFVMDSILMPEHLGLALETNLIRGIAPDSIYQAVKTVTNDAAAQIRAFDSSVKLSVSVQVDRAWGYMGNTGYEGVEQDFEDFPFIDELGLSSYPYFSFDTPGEIPLNYYSRLVEEHPVPVFVSEGGWSSETVYIFEGNVQKQKEYIIRQSELLDESNATAFFQLTFTDIDMDSIPPEIPSSLSYFAHIGLVDIDLQPKPALEAWDSLFAINRTDGN